MENTVLDFFRILETKRLEACRLLRNTNPVSEEAFGEFKDAFGLPFPLDLAGLYRTLNGYQPSDYGEEKQLVPGLYLLPFSDSIKQYATSPYGPNHNRKEWILMDDKGGKILFRRVDLDNLANPTIYVRCLESGI